jgi:hypothetical protein
MKTILKLAACLIFVVAVNNSFAQQAANAPAKQTSTKTSKSKKGKTGIDNKIAVSDQVQPTDKGTKSAKKTTTTGISNK